MLDAAHATAPDYLIRIGMVRPGQARPDKVRQGKTKPSEHTNRLADSPVDFGAAQENFSAQLLGINHDQASAMWHSDFDSLLICCQVNNSPGSLHPGRLASPLDSPGQPAERTRSRLAISSHLGQSKVR